MAVTNLTNRISIYGGEKFFDHAYMIDNIVTVTVPYKPSRPQSGSAFSMALIKDIGSLDHSLPCLIVLRQNQSCMARQFLNGSVTKWTQCLTSNARPEEMHHWDVSNTVIILSRNLGGINPAKGYAVN